MSNPDIRQRVHELLAEGKTHREIAEILNIGVGTVSSYRNGGTFTSETSEVKGDQWTITLPKTRIQTLEELLAHCKVDLSIWEVERFICNKWEMGYKNRLEEADYKELFQVKAFLRKKKAAVAAKKEIEVLKNLAKQSARQPIKIVRPPLVDGNLLEINIPDLHAGKLAWGEETGAGNYNTRMAVHVFNTALESLLERVKGHKFETVLFVVGNDLLNSDDIEGRTTKGTHVSTDTRYHKTFAAVREMKVAAIERLRKVAKQVRVVMVPGNHDTLSVWHLGDSLECYFHNYDDVEIDNSPRNRKYVQFGKVMLMFTHGDKAKRNDYPLLMATEQPAMFGATKFREAHTGHNHMTKLDEQHGVRVRILPALTAADDWHAENGFVGNLRSAEAYIWNKDEGLIGTAIYSEIEKVATDAGV